jgi:hypothetical protein
MLTAMASSDFKKARQSFLYLLSEGQYMKFFVNRQPPCPYIYTYIYKQVYVHNYICTVPRVARWYLFKPKIPMLIFFGMPLNGTFWYVLWTFGILKVVC